MHCTYDVQASPTSRWCKHVVYEHYARTSCRWYVKKIPPTGLFSRKSIKKIPPMGQLFLRICLIFGRILRFLGYFWGFMSKLEIFLACTPHEMQFIFEDFVGFQAIFGEIIRFLGYFLGFQTIFARNGRLFVDVHPSNYIYF